MSQVALSAGYAVLTRVYRARSRLSRLRNQPAILVYQMAKVGSQTVTRSIRASKPGRPVFFVHTLTPEGIAALDEFYRSSGVPYLPWGGHLLVSRYLEQQIRLGVTPGRWKVVTLVRDPVARSMSLLFQLGSRLLPDFEERCDAGRLDPVSLVERFQTTFPIQVDCMRWFREELQRVFDVDVFGVPFDREVGFQVYPGPIADVLLIKTESLDRCGKAALRSFLGLAKFRWKHANVGTRKASGARYASFLEHLQLPMSFVDRYYRTSDVRHFYTAQELERFRSRWCGEHGGIA